MRIGVTGENGFIGQNFCKLLREKEIAHLKYDRQNHGDLDCDGNVEQFVKECKDNNCQTIVHFAGLNRWPKEIEILESHVLSTFWLSKHCLEHKIKLIVSGSRSRLGYYGAGKAISKKIISNFRMLGLSGIYISLPNVFGPHCKPNYNSFVSTILHCIAHNDKSYKEKITNGSSELRLIHVNDVCCQIKKICAMPDADVWVKYTRPESVEFWHQGEFSITIDDFCKVAMGEKPAAYVDQKHVDSITQTLDWYKNNEV